MAVIFRFPFVRSNNYLGAYRLSPASKNALPVLESMEFPAASNSFSIVAGAATYTISGTTASLRHSDLITALAGAYTINGSTAALTYGPVSSSFSLIAGAGSYALVGTASILKSGRLTTAQAGAYNLAGANATLAYAATAAISGDGDYPRHKGVRPIVRIRPKAERDLDDVLELVETVTATQRVGQSKKNVKTALAIANKIEAEPVFTTALAEIQHGLASLARATAMHEGAIEAAEKIASDTDRLVSEMQTRRKRHEREEKEIAAYMAHLLDIGYFE